MDFKEIKKKKHFIFDSEVEFRLKKPNYPKLVNWRVGEQGDWVLTDDDCIVQILKKGVLKDVSKNREYVRTICGTFLLDATKKMFGEIAENIYTFSGNNGYQKFYKRNKYTSREMMFVRYMASGKDAVNSYLDSYQTNNPQYAAKKSAQLLKTERVQTMIKEEIKKILEEEGVTASYIIERMKTIADLAEQDNVKLRSLESLAKIAGLFDNEKKQEQLTVWAGFTPEQLVSLKADENKLIAHKEKTESK